MIAPYQSGDLIKPHILAAYSEASVTPQANLS